MLSGEFERKLKRLNADLRVFCGNDDSKPAGLWRFKHSEMDDMTGGYDLICGVDKNFVDEFPEWGEDGRIVRSGWRRVLRILITQKLIDRLKAQRVFGVDLCYASRKERPLPKPTKRALIDKYVVPSSIGAM